MTDHLPHQEAGEESNAHSSASSLSYAKILVAVDYLDTTPKILEQAVHLAKTQGSHLMFFCCLQGRITGATDLTIYAGMAGYGGIYSQEMVKMEEKLVEETTEELKAWLGGLVQQAIQEGLKAIGDYSYGEPGRQICAKAKEWEANLIVVGRRGRTGISELLLGSVSNYVIHHAPCSVLVVQQ